MNRQGAQDDQGQDLSRGHRVIEGNPLIKRTRRYEYAPSNESPHREEILLQCRRIEFLPVYKCPADEKVGPGNGRVVRSYSINIWMGTMDPAGESDPTGATASMAASGYRVFKRQTDILNPANIWTAMDEDPNSINDSALEVWPVGSQWIDSPAHYHHNSGSISFSDGHVEARKWTDAGILAGKGNFFGASANSGDLIWLQQRTTNVR